jgi:hypothetical protein
MKNQQKFRWLISIVPVIALIVFVPACATQTGDVANSNVQANLDQAGFKVKTATTSQQRQNLESLPEHQFTVVKQNGENFYVWPDKPNNRLYGGNEHAYRAYKKYVAVAQARKDGAIAWIADPGGNAIQVTVYHGWAPFRDW